MLQAEATLADGDSKVDFITLGGETPELEVDTAYRFEDIKIDSDQDGVLKAEYRDGATSVYQLEESVSQTGLTRHGNDEPPKDAEAATDGGATAEQSENADDTVPADAEGTRANVNRLVDLLETEGAMERATLVVKATQQYDLDPEKAEAALSAGKERGTIMEAPDGGLKSAR